MSFSPANPATAPGTGGRAVRTLVLAVPGSVLLVSGILAAVIALWGRWHWWSAWGAATGVSILAAAVSLAALAPGILLGGQFAAYGYMAGAAVRVIVTLGGCIAAVLLLHTPPQATVVMIAPLYAAQLVVECVVLARAFWPGHEHVEHKHP